KICLCWKLRATAFKWCAAWRPSSAKPWSWRVATWTSSRRPTPIMIKSAPCASAKPTWPARPKPFGCRIPEPRSGETGFTLIAQEVLSDPQLLSIVRLCGVRVIVAFALGALVGDIHRFAEPRKLVKYIGLNPAFDDSGQTQWSGGIGGQGRKDLRCLLVEGAQAILRCSSNPLAQWGKRLLARKGSLNLAVCAVARRLAVAVWYLMMGRWTTLEQIDKGLELKIGKII